MNLIQLEGNTVISNLPDYNKLYNYRSPHPDCAKYVLPEIDFQKQTLVGIDASATGCSDPEILFKIDKKAKGCLVDLTIKPVGTCTVLLKRRIWMVVEKSDCKRITFKE